MIDDIICGSSKDFHAACHYYIDASVPNDPGSSQRILRALLKQAYDLHNRLRGSFPKALLNKLQKAFSSWTSTPHIPLMTELLKELLASLDKCVFAVDGLDYLPENDILTFLRIARNVFNDRTMIDKGHKLIMFCRDTLARGVHIQTHKHLKILQIEKSHVKVDIHTYVDHQIEGETIDRTITEDEALMDEVRQALKDNHAKM